MAVVAQWAGGVTETEASVVYRLDAAGDCQLATSLSADLSSPVLHGVPVATDAQNVARLAASGLTPGEHYYYGVQVGGVLQPDGRGEFTTAASGPQSFAFAFASCCDPDRAEATAAFDSIRTSGARFFVDIGDLHYSDIGVNDPALFRTAYDQVQQHAAIAALLAAMPVAYVWDDHDYAGNDSHGSSTAGPAAETVYRERVAHYPLPSASGIWQTFTMGRCRFVLLDSRSARSPSGDPDGPGKTMLGAEQKAWLLDTLAAATEDVLFVFSPVGWNDPSPSPSGDAWGSYATERAELLDAFEAGGYLDRLYFLSGDAHMLAADDGSNTPGGFPAVHGAALAQNPSRKGGRFSHGAAPGTGQYGLVTVEDDGGPITVRFSGRDSTREHVAMTTVFGALPPERTRAFRKVAGDPRPVVLLGNRGGLVVPVNVT